MWASRFCKTVLLLGLTVNTKLFQMKKHKKIASYIFLIVIVFFTMLWISRVIDTKSKNYIFYRGICTVLIFGTIGFYHKDKLREIKNEIKAIRLRKKVFEKLKMQLDALRDKDQQRVLAFSPKVVSLLGKYSDLDTSSTEFNSLIKYKQFLESLNEYNFKSKTDTPEYAKIISIISKILTND